MMIRDKKRCIKVSLGTASDHKIKFVAKEKQRNII